MKMDKKKMAMYGGGVIALALAGYYGYMFWQKRKATMAGVSYTPMGRGPFYDQFDHMSDAEGLTLVDNYSSSSTEGQESSLADSSYTVSPVEVNDAETVSGFGFEQSVADFGNEEVLELTPESGAMADDMGDNPFCD